MLTDLALWDIDVDGGFRSLSGTTVNFELNSSGLLRGSTAVINSSGELVSRFFQRTVTAATTGANYSVTTAMNGHIINVGDNNATSQLVLLPANPPAGFWFEVTASTQTGVDGVSIHSTADSSAVIILPGLTSVASTIQAIQPGSVRAHAVRMTAVSSVVWWAEPLGQIANAETTLANAVLELNWTTATTIA